MLPNTDLLAHLEVSATIAPLCFVGPSMMPSPSLDFRHAGPRPSGPGAGCRDVRGHRDPNDGNETPVGEIRPGRRHSWTYPDSRTVKERPEWRKPRLEAAQQPEGQALAPRDVAKDSVSPGCADSSFELRRLEDVR